MSGGTGSRSETGCDRTEEMSKFLQKELELDNHWKVTLVGIGAGARDQVTLEAKRCCQEADLLIGAERMIEAVAEVGQTVYEAYRPDEIISYIKENPEYENVTIALSGDTGFYSGAKDGDKSGSGRIVHRIFCIEAWHHMGRCSTCKSAWKKRESDGGHQRE